MEPARIDWKRIDSSFVEDVFYEHIRAPKWFDFLAPDHHQDDDSWFCRPDCNHPKTPEDFLVIPSASKLPSSGDSNEIISFIDQKQRDRDTKLKRQGPSISNEDSENQNPNLETKSWRREGRFKSSWVKNEEGEGIRSTLSTRNLLLPGSGRDILGHLSEFCNELKKFASRVTEGEERQNKNSTTHGKLEAVVVVKEKNQQGMKKERMPLLQLQVDDKADHKGANKNKIRRNKRVDDDDAENITPVPVCGNLENVKSKREGRLLQSWMDPPSPQCFSAAKAPPSSRAAASTRPVEGVAEEMGGKESSVAEAPKEGRMMEFLWFLKPCTLAG